MLGKSVNLITSDGHEFVHIRSDKGGRLGSATSPEHGIKVVLDIARHVHVFTGSTGPICDLPWRLRVVEGTLENCGLESLKNWVALIEKWPPFQPYSDNTYALWVGRLMIGGPFAVGGPQPLPVQSVFCTAAQFRSTTHRECNVCLSFLSSLCTTSRHPRAVSEI